MSTKLINNTLSFFIHENIFQYYILPHKCIVDQNSCEINVVINTLKMWKIITDIYKKLYNITEPKTVSDVTKDIEKNLPQKKKNNNYNSAHDYFMNKINKNWIINLTDEIIPDEVLHISSLGKKFGVPYFDKNNIPIEMILTTFELNLDLIDEDKRNDTRYLLKNEIEKYCQKKTKLSYRRKLLMKNLKITQQFKKKHPDILFSKSDKSNVTVILKHDFYMSKMHTLLNDKNTYQAINHDPTYSIEITSNKLIYSWYKKKFIDEDDKYYLLSKNGNVALAYGLPKIHKENIPFRIIVSFINTPTYHLAKYLQNILSLTLKSECKTNRFNKKSMMNSFELVSELRKLKLPRDFYMISMDVVSLFTNVPLNLVIDGIEKRWHIIKRHTKIDKKEFIKAISLCFKASAFKFDNVYYQQVFGAAMGSPLSPIVAEIVLQDLEKVCLEKLKFDIYFYTRYVDDILVFLLPDKINIILDVFNNYHERLKFTIESEVNCKINFLEVTLIRSSDKLLIDWYTKPTSSGRYLNYYSHHPKNQKIGAIYNLVDRAILLSDANFHLKNLEFIRNLLMKNGYPYTLLQCVMKRRERLIFGRQINNSNTLQNEKIDNNFVCLPYVEELSERLKLLFQNLPIQLTFKNTNNLSWLFSGHKDQLPIGNMNKIVYKIPCANCDFVFVDQTKKKLSTRLKELKFSILNPCIDSWSTALTCHVVKLNHNFDFVKTKILYKEKSYEKRKLLTLLSHGKFNDNESIETIDTKLSQTSSSSPSPSPSSSQSESQSSCSTDCSSNDSGIYSSTFFDDSFKNI